MALYGKEFAIEEKDIIVKHLEEVFSTYKIQESIGINCRIILKFFNRIRERQNVENLPRSVGRRKMTKVLRPIADRLLRTLQLDLRREHGVVFLRELIAEDCFSMDTNARSCQRKLQFLKKL